MLVDKGYIAGILDGEGCVCVRRVKGRYRLPFYYDVVIRITNTDRSLLHHVQREYGGSITQKAQKQRRRVVYELCISGHEAQRLLRETLPFLIVKRQQAKLALGMPRRVIGRELPPEVYRKQKEIYKGIKLLNKRGFRAEQIAMTLEEEIQGKLF